MEKWSLKPDNGMVDYLTGKKSGSSSSSGGKRWAPKPSQDMMSYLDEAGNAEMPPAELKPIFDAKDHLNAFNKWNERKIELWGQNGFDVGKAYDMTKEFGPLPKTREEIQALLYLIPEENARWAGVFISYLVNEIYQYNTIELRTGKPIGFLGTKNANKKLTIIGNVGDDAGTSMTGGELVIKGNSGDDIGWSMKGGKIVVEGGAGWRVGDYRSGGEIHLLGNYESIGDSYYDTWKTGGKGAVYHKGKQIYENGRAVS